MRRKILVFLSVTAIILSVAAVGCNNEVDEEIISFTDTAVENVLVSLNEQDFESYNKDMDDEMLKVVTEEYFTTLFTYLKDAIGEYEKDSKRYIDSYVQGDIYVVIYGADYTEEPEDVIVTGVVSVTDDGVYQISGTWFDSPKLRETENEG